MSFGPPCHRCGSEENWYIDQEGERCRCGWPEVQAPLLIGIDMAATPDQSVPTVCFPGISGIEAEVCADIAARQQLGIAKYGMTVAENPEPLAGWLKHAYQETLDKAIYLKRAMAALDAENTETSDRL